MNPQARAQALFLAIRGRWDLVWTRFQTLPPLARRLSVVAGLLVFLAAVQQGILAPLERSIRALDAKILAAEKRSLEVQKSVRLKPEVGQSYALLRQSLDFSASSDEGVRASMLKDIENFARGEQMNLSEVRPQISAERGRFKEISVRMQVDGSLDQLMRFFANLVRTRRLYSISNLRITPHPEDVRRIRANITVARAFFPPGQNS